VASVNFFTFSCLPFSARVTASRQLATFQLKPAVLILREIVVSPWLVLICLIISGCAARHTPLYLSRPVEFDKADYRLIWPLPIVTTARITSSFGKRKDPLTGMISFHTGVDLDGELGTAVHSSAKGRVVFGGQRQGYGLLLIIDHGNGLETYYGHCSRILCKRGDLVNRGQVVALMGATGRTSGNHLHFETRKHGQPFDPCQLLPKLKEI
jgi:murein DD-endopeptidase MepM/ murein hydrolase activator NlpD